MSSVQLLACSGAPEVMAAAEEYKWMQMRTKVSLERYLSKASFFSLVLGFFVCFQGAELDYSRELAAPPTFFLPQV